MSDKKYNKKHVMPLWHSLTNEKVSGLHLDFIKWSK